MNKVILLLLIATFSCSGYCQSGITFKVEKLSKPEKTLPETSQKEIFERLIRADVGIDSMRPLETDADFPYDIVAQSKAPPALVDCGYHSFFHGMERAYAEHRPFVLSPDMIWLLISQGFARHVNANSERLRNRFVDYSGKTSLLVRADEVRIDDPNAPWEKVFPKFTQQIAGRTGSDMVKILSADFSTTTPVEKMASDITIMEAMKSYFEYVHLFAICGIPEITLQGTPEDWQKILDKTKALAEYDLAWWTREMKPILKEFVAASRGKVKKAFWRNMFKSRRRGCGKPDVIDGWIIKFFPYDKDGKRNNLKELHGLKSLPNEIVKVDLNYFDIEANKTTPLELWAGFVGLGQNPDNHALTPKIGWMIRKADTGNTALKKSLGIVVEVASTLVIRVKEVPPEILEINRIGGLSIIFLDKIIIPDRMAEINIDMLLLSGKTDEAEAKRIKSLFPNTMLYINGKKY